MILLKLGSCFVFVGSIFSALVGHAGVNVSVAQFD